FSRDWSSDVCSSDLIRFHEKGRLLLTPLAHKILFEGRKVKLATLQLKEKIDKKEHVKKPEAFGLFEKLKQLRREIAIEESVPARSEERRVGKESRAQ